MSITSATQPAERQLLSSILRRFRSDTRGTTVIEYAVIASVLTIALIAALPHVGGATNTLYNKISNATNSTP